MQKKKVLFHQDNILQICPPATTGSLLTWKKCPGKEISETEAYFESKDESFYKKSARFAGTFSLRASRAARKFERA